jgi:hypothetical protein
MSNSVKDSDSPVVTPAMLEAGLVVLSQSGISDEYLEGDKLTLAQIYRAMFAHRPQNESATPA